MIIRRCLGLSLFAALSLSAADPRWIRMKTSNFEMYSSANERATRDTLKHFEQVHGFFAQLLGTVSAKGQPVKIVAFGNVKDYEPYKFNEVAFAYYHPTPDADYIVMSQAGAEYFPTAVHEYVHLVFRNAKMNFPPWLNEGLAEVYSTLRPAGNGILVGSLVQGRMQSLGRDKWVPLSILLSADHTSAYYNEKSKAGSLYNEGWALTHMLAMSPEYRPKFSGVMDAIAGGASSIATLEKVYGKPLSAIEQDLQAYLRGSNFSGVMFPVKLERVTEDLTAEPAPDFELKLTLADLTNGPGKEDDTRKRYEQLLAEDPKRFEPYAALGYLKWRKGGANDAADDFGKAFSLGDRNPRLLWDYGRMAERKGTDEPIQVFTELLKLEPERLDVRVELASVEIRAKKYPEALGTLSSVHKITEQEAPRFFTMLAYANFYVGDRTEAGKAAQRVVNYAKTPEARSQADQLLKYLAESDRYKAAPPPLASLEGRPPVLERRDAPGTDVGPAQVRALSNLPSVSGVFLLLDCQDSQLRMTVQTGAAEKRIFLIEDPTKVLISGRDSATIDMNCGAQKPAQVKIEYAPPAANQTAIDGVVRTINFLN